MAYRNASRPHRPGHPSRGGPGHLALVLAADAMRTSRATTLTPVLSTFDVDRSTLDVLEDRVMQRHPRATAAAGIGYLVLTSAGLVLAPMLDLGSSESAVRDYLRTLDTA